VTVDYSFTKTPVMPTGISEWRTEIPRHVAGGRSNIWIARKTQHGRNFIQEICHGPKSPSDHLARNDRLGATRNVTRELMSEVNRLAHTDPRLEQKDLARILKGSNGLLPSAN
jgi:hypothetical protein